MSQDDLAMIFQRGMEAYSRDDCEVTLVGFDPATEWRVDPTLIPDATTYNEHEGVKKCWEIWAAAISGMVLEIEACHCVEQNPVLAITRAHGTGADRAAPVRIWPFRADRRLSGRPRR